MPYEIAKLLLEHAGTFLDRTAAVRTAVRLGMPLSAIEEYLDWLDSVRSSRPKGEPPDSSSENPNGSSATPSSGASPLDATNSDSRATNRFFRFFGRQKTAVRGQGGIDTPKDRDREG